MRGLNKAAWNKSYLATQLAFRVNQNCFISVLLSRVVFFLTREFTKALLLPKSRMILAMQPQQIESVTGGSKTREENNVSQNTLYFEKNGKIAFVKYSSFHVVVFT